MNFPGHVLLNSLKKELRYEKSLDKNLIYLSEFLRKHSLVQKMSEKSKKVNLYKQNYPYKIQIEFLSSNPKMKFTDEEESSLNFPAEILKNEYSNFCISIQKESSQNLHIQCYTDNTKIWVQDLIFTKDIPEHIFPLFSDTKGQTNYNVLNETLQKLIIDWLQSIGITEDLGKYVGIMGIQKERELYKQWLSDMCNLISHQL
jgi:Mitochondrial glycoprotein